MVSLLTAKNVLGDKEDIRGTLSQASHEVGIPFGPKRNVDAHAPALFHQGLLQIPANTVEHLEFERGGRNVLLASPILNFLDDLLVVGRESVEGSALQEILRHAYIIAIDFRFWLKGDLRRFLVGALAETNANAFGAKRFCVIGGAPHIGLQNRTDVSGVSGLAMELASEIQGLLRVGRAFHINADEVLNGHRVIEKFADDTARQILVDVQTHVSQLEADIGIEFPLINFIEKLMVKIAAMERFVAIGDIFAKVVDTDADAKLIDGFGGLEKFFDSGPSYESAGHLLSQ